ncbi:MAG: CHAT domain-containing tetratricopeptide repeat protein [Candidatus Eisenbacteria bacterium]
MSWILPLVLSLLALAARPVQASSGERARLEEIRALILRKNCAAADSLADLMITRAASDSIALALAWDAKVEATRCFGRVRAKDALEMARRVFDLRRRLPNDAIDAAWSESNLGAALIDLGNVEEGVQAIRHAKAVIDPLSSTSDTLRARHWNRLGVALEAARQFAAAESAYTVALELRRRAFGPLDLETLQSLSNVASALAAAGRPKEALPLYRDLVEGRKRLLGANARETGAALSALADAEWAFGSARAARRHSEEALRILEAAGPAARYAQAVCRQRIGYIARAAGDFAEAERQYEAAAELLRALEGPESPNVGQLEVDLGGVARERGDYARAEERIRAGLARMEKGLGPRHARLYPPLIELAHCLKEAQRTQEAKAIYEQGIELFTAAGGADHPKLLGAVSGLADCEERLGDAEAAYQGRLRALDLVRKAEGPESDRAQFARLNLAISLRDLGRLDEAEQEARGALAVMEAGTGARGPAVAGGALILSRILARTPARSVNAMAEALRAEEVGREQLRSTARTLSEREALAYARSRPRGLPAALSLLLARPASLPDRAVQVADACVRGRALIEDELLHELRAQAGLDPLLVDSLRADIAEARAEDPAEADRLERALVARLNSAHSADTTASGFDAVVRALPAGATLAAFVRFEREPIDGAPTGPWYAVYTVRAEEREPHFTALAPADSIDAAVRAWRDEVGRAPEGPLAELDAAQAGLALRRLVWDRWHAQEIIASASDLYLVPDGQLLLVNFGALPLDLEPGGSVRYLFEDAPLLHLLNAERDLVTTRAKEDHADRSGPLLALGDPDFDHAPDTRGLPSIFSSLASAIALERGPEQDCRTGEALRFSALPGARQELQEVTRLFERRDRRVELRTGTEASKASFLARAGQASALHLATHAYYLDCANDETSPLLRSGVALAGANRRDRPGEGLLTAAEVGVLDLDHVEVAVLSACETGVGEVMAGEGVLGLRRAFKVAGVESLVTALWSIDDRATRDFMTSFYAQASEHSSSGALRATERALLASRRAAGASTHPFYWGAFVATGD